MASIQSIFTLNLGSCIGLFDISYSFGPPGSSLNAIPCRISVEYNGVLVDDSGFSGDPNYTNQLVQMGYTPVVSNSGSGSLKVNKTTTSPATATVVVDSPLPGSRWEFTLTNCPICNTPTPTITPTIVPTPTPNPTATPISTSTPGTTLTPAPTATPIPTSEPGVTSTPGPTTPPTPTNPPSPTTPPTTPIPTTPPAACQTCDQNPACCCSSGDSGTTADSLGLDYSFLIKNDPLSLDSIKENSVPPGCCSCTPTGGGDIHYGWSGRYTSSILNLDSHHVMVDDNYIYGEEIIPGQKNYSFDHYAIEWVEKTLDGKINAIITKRIQVCKWPGTTVCGGVIIVGRPIGAEVNYNCRQLSSVPCGDCNPAIKWCRHTINLKPHLFSSIQSYGGIYWELMKWISQISDSVGPNGFTGPIGKKASFWNFRSFRFIREDFEEAIRDGNGNSLLSNQSPYFVYQKINSLSDKINNWVINNEQNIANEIMNRKAIFNTLVYSGGSTSPCCTSNDIDFENDCSSPDCPQPNAPTEEQCNGLGYTGEYPYLYPKYSLNSSTCECECSLDASVCSQIPGSDGTLVFDQNNCECVPDNDGGDVSKYCYKCFEYACMLDLSHPIPVGAFCSEESSSLFDALSSCQAACNGGSGSAPLGLASLS